MSFIIAREKVLHKAVNCKHPFKYRCELTIQQVTTQFLKRTVKVIDIKRTGFNIGIVSTHKILHLNMFQVLLMSHVVTFMIYKMYQFEKIQY